MTKRDYTCLGVRREWQLLPVLLQLEPMSKRYEAMATHVCAACGGDGEGEDVFYQMNCPACRGLGTISDRMPVADAVADAETLRSNSTYQFDLPEQVSFGKPLHFQASVLAKLAFAAVPELRRK